jgi:hypothetical protein
VVLKEFRRCGSKGETGVGRFGVAAVRERALEGCRDALAGKDALLAKELDHAVDVRPTN